MNSSLSVFKILRIKSIGWLGLLFFTLFVSTNLHSRCAIYKHNKEGDKGFEFIQKLSPTQAVYGKLAIRSKTKKVEEAYRNSELEDYLKMKVAPIIIGPGCKKYIIDRHHTSLAILAADIPEKEKRLYTHLIYDWSSKSNESFEADMIKNRFTWLKDENYQLIKFSSLPKKISQLKDEPLRSLAWKVRKEGGFIKVNVPFLEFYWAEFYRNNGIMIQSSEESEILKVLDSTLKLSLSPKAKNMPGFKAK